jgi:hypothetical protein
MEFTNEEMGVVTQLPFITAKPLVFACNIGTEDYEGE